MRRDGGSWRWYLNIWRGWKGVGTGVGRHGNVDKRGRNVHVSWDFQDIKYMIVGLIAKA